MAEAKKILVEQTMIQIFGTKKCKDTQKAIRFFKERNIQIQFIDLSQKGISKGELRSVAQSVGLENLINPKSKEYEKQNLEYIHYDKEEKILDFPMILKTPIVRMKTKATVGYEPDSWKLWIT